MEIVFKHIWKPLVSLKTGRAVENGRQLISLQFGKSIGGQRGGPSVHTHRRVRWSCQCCPCWAHPTAAGQLLLLLLPLKYVEHQRGSGTSNRNSEKTQFVFFPPLLSTGFSFPTAVMIKDAFWSWRLWIILSTSYHFISPRPPFITVIPMRAVCPPGYVNPFPVISLACSMSSPINYIKNKTGWWKKKKMFHILRAVSGQRVFVPTSLMKWKKVNI